MRASDARILARRCCSAASLVFAVGIAVVGFAEPYALARELFWIQGSGYAALTALLLALTTSPLAAVARFFGLQLASGAAVGAFRRSFGLSAASFAALHAVLVLSTYLADAWLAVLGRPFLRSGALALCILLAMALTSFPRLVRALHVDLWKQLHALGFAAALLVLHHLLLAPFASRTLTIAIFLSAALIAPFRLMRGPPATR